MSDQELLDACTRILQDLLGDHSIVLTMESRRTDVANWDSFSYVSFIVAVEMAFGVTFGVGEVESFENVGAIVRRLSALLRAR